MVSLADFNWAWQQPLPPPERLVLMAIADGMEGIAHIARHCCLPITECERIHDKLVIDGWMTADHAMRREG